MGRPRMIGQFKPYLPNSQKEAFSVYCLACKHEVRVGAFIDENAAKKECEWLEKLNYGGAA